jgi:hypothetical protein
LETKAQLFEWLNGKFPGMVNLDIETVQRPRLADILVEPASGRKFVYWVFSSAIRNREAYLNCKEETGNHSFHFVHTQSARILQSEKELSLTASQRDFISRSKFDEALSSPFASTELRLAAI